MSSYKREYTGMQSVARARLEVIAALLKWPAGLARRQRLVQLSIHRGRSLLHVNIEQKQPDDLQAPPAPGAPTPAPAPPAKPTAAGAPGNRSGKDGGKKAAAAAAAPALPGQREPSLESLIQPE
jgi:hypothetical protein